MSDDSKKIFADDVVQDVQSTWSTINGNLQEVGFAVFQRLFTNYPDYQKLFNAFKDIPLSELKNNEDFRKHALTVATALNTAIEKLEEPEHLVLLLTTVGKSHVKRNVHPEYYSNTQIVIFEVIESSLGDKFTDKISSSWNEVLAVAVSTIMKGMQEEESKYM